MMVLITRTTIETERHSHQWRKRTCRRPRQKTSAVRERSRSFRAHDHHGEADEGGTWQEAQQRERVWALNCKEGVDPALPAATRKEPRPDAVPMGVERWQLRCLVMRWPWCWHFGVPARARRTKATGRPWRYTNTGDVKQLGTLVAQFAITVEGLLAEIRASQEPSEQALPRGSCAGVRGLGISQPLIGCHSKVLPRQAATRHVALRTIWTWIAELACDVSHDQSGHFLRASRIWQPHSRCSGCCLKSKGKLDSSGR